MSRSVQGPKNLLYIGFRRYFLRGKCDRNAKQIILFHLTCARSHNSNPPHVFNAWCLIKYRDKFIFTKAVSAQGYVTLTYNSFVGPVLDYRSTWLNTCFMDNKRLRSSGYLLLTSWQERRERSKLRKLRHLKHEISIQWECLNLTLGSNYP
jgi:hypothetical protein